MTKKPVRIQRKRTKGFRLREESKKANGLDYAIVSRPSKWGNPFSTGDKKLDVENFRVFIFGKGKEVTTFDSVSQYLLSVSIDCEINELKGKNLVCWCALSEPYCHADVLLELANR